MPVTHTRAARISAITSCVPSRRFDNLTDTTNFERAEVEKVVRMAGVKKRHLAGDQECSSDLCLAAARDVLQSLNWQPETVDGLIMVTQSPDYFLPSTACLIHRDLGLSDKCAAFDVGLGCSGYTYGLWLAAMMLQGQGGLKRVLLLHGETPSRFSDHSDRSVALLFGDAGSATALEPDEHPEAGRWWFSLHTDGTGCKDLIIEGGGFRNRFPDDRRQYFLHMKGANIFNFTIKRVPRMIEDTLGASGLTKDQIDYYIFHQSNRFIMKHLATKCGLAEDRIPMTIGEFGSSGGPSVPLTMVRGNMNRPADKSLQLLLLAYGVGLSWGSALIKLPARAILNHMELPAQEVL